MIHTYANIYIYNIIKPSAFVGQLYNVQNSNVTVCSVLTIFAVIIEYKHEVREIFHIICFVDHTIEDKGKQEDYYTYHIELNKNNFFFMNYTIYILY